MLSDADRKWLGEMRSKGAGQLDAREKAKLLILRRYHHPEGADAEAVDVLLGLAEEQDQPEGSVKRKAAALIRERHPELAGRDLGEAS